MPVFVVERLEAEGSGFPDHLYNVFRGVGRSRRSVKAAGEAAERALRANFRRGGSRKDADWVGIPTLSVRTVYLNGRVVHDRST